jgi:predicted small secreted protein
VLKLVTKLMLVLGIASFGLNLAACNTVEGTGQDVKNVGQGMKNASENVQDKM